MTSGDRPEVAVVCRGSVTEGLGHVVRAASVAQALADRGAVVHGVLLGDKSAAAVWADSGMPFQAVSGEGAAATAVECRRSSAIVFDLLDLDDAAFERLAAGRRTASLSPVFRHQHRVDLSFSRSCHEPDPALRADPGRHRRGPQYTVLRAGIRALDSDVYRAGLDAEPLSVGVTMGGADAPNRTLMVLEELRDFRVPLLVWVMLGEGYGHAYEPLVERLRCDRDHEVVLAKTSRSMWTVLQRCALVVTAGGLTTYEAAFVGVPSLSLLRTPASSFLVRELEEAGAGRCLLEEAGWGARLRETLRVFDADRARLWDMHQRSRGLIDGQGAARVAAELEGLFTLVPARPAADPDGSCPGRRPASTQDRVLEGTAP